MSPVSLCCILSLAPAILAPLPTDECRYTEQAIVVPADRAVNDRFGTSLILDGDRAFFGAFLDDEFGDSAGAAYAFHWDGKRWIEGQKIVASDAQPLDTFGTSMDVCGDVLVISAVGFEFPSQWVRGAVYVFRDQGGVWVEEQKLLASDGGTGEQFGCVVAVEGDRLIASAPLHGASGAVYAFEFDGTQWQETQKLIGSRPKSSDQFGISLDLDGDTLVIGADEGGESAKAEGKAYVFRHDGSGWFEEQRLRASDRERGDQFGGGVTLQGERLVVGAWKDSEAIADAGSMYTFDYDGTRWNEVGKQVPSDISAFARFGRFLDLDGDRLLVSAFTDSETAYLGGAAYVYEWDGTHWGHERKIIASDPEPSDLFGVGLDLDGDRALLGLESVFREGAVYCHVFTELALMARPHEVLLGESLTLETCGGLPNGPVLLAAVDVGFSIFVPVARGKFDQAGRWEFNAPHSDPALSGLEIVFQSFGPTLRHLRVEASDPERVTLR